MSNIILKVQVEGGLISCIAKETISLANKLDAIIEFEFNGTVCRARPGDQPENLVDIYYRMREKE